jgi:DNA polymerase III alpha subunit
MACIKITRMSKTKKQERTAKYVLEGRRIGIGVSAPDINTSGIDISKIDGGIYFGLADVKFVGAPAARWIIANRPYASYDDFIEKLEAAQGKWEETDKKSKSARQQIKRNQIENLRNVGAFAILDGKMPEDVATHEQLLLGVVLSDNVDEILEEYSDEFEDLDTYETAMAPGDVYSVAGVITSIRETITRYGNDMAWVTIEWPDPDGGYQEFVFSVFEEKLNAYKFLLKVRTIGIFTVKTNEKGSTLEHAKKYEAARASV